MLTVTRGRGEKHGGPPAIGKADTRPLPGYCSDMDAVPSFYVPTPETEPAQIAADQRAAVAEAIPRVGTDPAALSAEVVLPANVVVRRLREIGHRVAAITAARPAFGRPKAGGHAPRSRATSLAAFEQHLRTHGPATAREIADAIGGYYPANVCAMLAGAFDRFEVVASIVRGNQPTRVWWLVGVPVPEVIGEPAPGAKRVRRTG